jgi:putative transposase
MDFIEDTLADGRTFRCLCVVDDFTRECPAIAVDRSLPAARVVAELEHLAGTRDLPEVIVCDNGSESTSRAFDAWAYRRGVRLLFIRPGKSVDNGFIESFHGRFRDEYPSEQWFTSRADTRALIEAWRREYNGARPHSGLAGRTPAGSPEHPRGRALHPAHNRWPSTGGKVTSDCGAILAPQPSAPRTSFRRR